MLCYRCGGHVKDGSEKCPSCGQPFALGLKPGSIAGFGTGSRRGRAAIEGAPYKIGDAIDGRFQVKDHLAAGPLGWVFRATDTESGESVALKVLSPRFLQLPEEQASFLTELERCRALDHANVSRTIASGLDGPRPWIASQLLDGLTLRRIMDLRRQKGQPFALLEVEPIVAQIAAGLEASPVAHGDLKPDNVVVLPDLLKLTDFGLALCLPRAPFVAAQRAAGVQRYFAPEILTGGALGGRADVFSLGVILGELLAGAPFDAQLEARVRGANIPAAVEQVFLRAVAPRADERYASAADLSLALTEAIHGAPAAPPDEDDVVIEHAQTDPRVRIARALAAQDAERSLRKEAEKEAKAGTPEAPPKLQLSLTPLPPLSVPPLSVPPLSLPPLSLQPFSAPPPIAAPPPAPASPTASVPAAERPGPAAQETPRDSSRREPEPREPALEAAPRAPAPRERDPREHAPVAAAPLATAPAVAPPAPPRAEGTTPAPPRTEATPPALAPPQSTTAAPAQSQDAQSHAKSLVATEGARGQASAEEVARVAARVGATPELLTAETAVRFAPTSPAASASPNSSEPPGAQAQAAAPVTDTGAPAASPAPHASGATASLSDDSDTETTEAADVPDAPLASEPPPGADERGGRGKRRGRGRRGKRDEGRATRTLESAPPSIDSGIRARAAAETQELLPLAPARPTAAIVAVPTISPAAPPRVLEKPAEAPPGPASRPPSRPPAAPSFGALASEKRGPSVPTIAIGVVVAIAVALFAWSQLSSRSAEEKPPASAAPSPSAPSAPAPPTPGPSSPAPSAPSATSTPAAPAPAVAPAPTPSEPARATGAAERSKEPPAELPPSREFEEKASKGGKKSFLERLRERRDASKHSQETPDAKSSGHKTESEPVPGEPASPAPAPLAPAPSAVAATPAAPAPVIPAPAAAPASSAPPAPAAAPAASASGGIGGIDDDNLLASPDPEKRKRAAAELAVAAGATPKAAAEVSAPAATSSPAVAPCQDGMKLIPAGAAHIGTDASDDMRNFGDRSSATVQLKAYCIDLYEWPDASGKAPKIAAGFSEADASCKRSGKRLCSEDEWEKACKGPADLRFPYGSAFDPDACNTQDRATNPRKIAASGSFPNCRSGYGVFDLSGNAAEWTASSFEGTGPDKVVKGGNATRPAFDDRCSSRRRLSVNTHDINVGFRCCQDAAK